MYILINGHRMTKITNKKLFKVSNSLLPDATMRRSLRVLKMVSHLHMHGYQFIRIAPYMAPSGLYWRCDITVKSNVLDSHGALIVNENLNTANYSSSMDNHYFDWTDTKNYSTRELANKFIEQFPLICEKGQGIDYEYAGWYVHMLGFAEKGCFPYAFSDSEDEDDNRNLYLTGNCDGVLPIPPGGTGSKRN